MSYFEEQKLRAMTTDSLYVAIGCYGSMVESVAIDMGTDAAFDEDRCFDAFLAIRAVREHIAEKWGAPCNV